MLDVVVQRPIDERDLAERKCDAGDPVVVVRATGIGNASASLSSSRLKSDAAPVTVFTMISEPRSVQLLRRSVQ